MEEDKLDFIMVVFAWLVVVALVVMSILLFEAHALIKEPPSLPGRPLDMRGL